MNLHQPFLLVPNIRFNVYLGQTFIMSEHFGMYHPKFVGFTTLRQGENVKAQNELMNCQGIRRARLKYFSKETYDEATRREADIKDEGPRITPRRGSTYEGETNSVIYTMESEVTKPKEDDKKGKLPTATGLRSQREFQKVVDKYDIDPEDHKDIWEAYKCEGSAPIPVSNFVEGSGRVDTFYENWDIYYNTIDELIKVLNLSHLPEKELETIKNFLKSNMDVFSRHDLDIGTVTDYLAKVTLNDNVSHFEMKHVPIPRNLRKRVGIMLDEYEDKGIIGKADEEVLDPLISNLIPLKKGEDKIRVVLDDRPQNHFAKKNKSSHTSLFETLYSVDLNAEHFSTIDLSSSYYSIRLHPSCYRFFCFYFGDKLYNFKRTPMGFSDSHNYLARVLNKIFPNRQNMWIYLDDLIITHRGTLSEAVEDIIGVLTKLKNAGLKVSPKKAALFRESVIFLGFMLKRGKISIPDHKIQGIMAVPPPNNRMALRKFINSLSFFRTNIPNFSELTTDLAELVNRTDRTKAGYVAFRLTPELREKFELLKDAARRSLPLYQTNFDKPIYCFSDSSKQSTSFVAFQLDCDDKAWFENPELSETERNKMVMEAINAQNGPPKRFVFCSSRRLTKAERNYSVFKLEMIALAHGLLSAKALFSFAKLKVFVDAKSILFIRLCRSSSDQVARLAVFLSSFEMELFHIPSSQNFLSDYLSRLPRPEEAADTEEQNRFLTEKESNILLRHLMLPGDIVLPTELVKSMLDDESPRVNLPGKKSRRKQTQCKSIPAEASCPALKRPRKIKDFQFDIVCESEVNMVANEEEENEYNPLQNFVLSANIFKNGQMTIEDFIAAQENCKLIQGALERGRPKIVTEQGVKCVEVREESRPFMKKRIKAIIPDSLLRQYANTLHFDMHTFHHSPPQILRKIKQLFYILDESTVKKSIGGCYLCQSSTPITDSRQQYALQKLPEKPRVHLAFDICGAINEDTSKYKYIYLCIDLFSNYVLGAAAKTRTALEILNFFRMTILNYCIVKKITLDGEISLLQNKEFNDFLAFYNIERHRTSWNNPEANGHVERQMFNVKRSVRILSTCHGSWSKYLPYLIASINNTCTSYGYSPSQVAFGEETLPRGDLIELRTDYSNTKEYMDQLKPFIEGVRKQHKKKKEQRIKSNLLYINKRRGKKDFVTGDAVILQSLHLTSGRGMKAIGAPGLIIDICKSGKSALVENILTHRVVKYNFSYLKRITTPILSKLPDEWKRRIEEISEAAPRDSSSQETQDGGSQEEVGPKQYSQTLGEEDSVEREPSPAFFGF